MPPTPPPCRPGAAPPGRRRRPRSHEIDERRELGFVCGAVAFQEEGLGRIAPEPRLFGHLDRGEGHVVGARHAERTVALDALIVAEKTGRRGEGIELDPRYRDVVVRRMAGAANIEAVHAATGKPFAEIGRERAAAAVDRPAHSTSRPGSGGAGPR